MEIGLDSGVGYAYTRKYTYPDTSWIFISYDNFENLTVQNQLVNCSEFINLIRGSIQGELYFISMGGMIEYSIFFSDDYGNNIKKINNLNFGFDYYVGAEGGRMEGEFYVILNYVFWAWQDAHTYILHSTDYGLTFYVYHPFAKGQPPLYANFSAIAQKETLHSLNPKARLIEAQSGPAPLEVQFHNYSIGNVIKCEWDFDNDGIVDSNDENPVFIYQDTGCYSVKLTVTDQWTTNTFLRENYIHVQQSASANDTPTATKNGDKISISCFPNPFKNQTLFNVETGSELAENEEIKIYNMQGKLIKRLSTQSPLIWDGKDMFNQAVSPGIYLYRLNDPESVVKKIVLL